MFIVRKKALTLVWAGVASVSLAHYPKTVWADSNPSRQEREVRYRQSVFTVIGANFAPLGAMADGTIPVNPAEAQLRAERVAFLASMLKEAFPADSNGVAQTAARPTVWSDAAGFDKELQAFVNQAGLLAAAAKSNDVAKIKRAIENTDDTCKGCHYDFKVRR